MTRKPVPYIEFRQTLLSELSGGFTYSELVERYSNDAGKDNRLGKINRWHLWKIAHEEDYTPSPRVCSILGIAVYRPAPACNVCGEVHTKKTCPRLRANGKSHPRLSVRLDDPASAARSLRRKLDAEAIAELIQYLSEGNEP